MTTHQRLGPPLLLMKGDLVMRAVDANLAEAFGVDNDALLALAYMLFQQRVEKLLLRFHQLLLLACVVVLGRRAMPEIEHGGFLAPA